MGLSLCIHCVKSVQRRSFFWSIFSYVRTEYAHLWSKSTIDVKTSLKSAEKLNSVYVTGNI